MKFYFSILLISFIGTPLFSQLSTIHFDKSRCQLLDITEIQNLSFPFVYSSKAINDFCFDYLNSNKADPNAKITIWKKVAGVRQFIRKQKLILPIAFPILETGSYVLISTDAIKTLFLEIEVTSSNVQTKVFYNCALHN